MKKITLLLILIATYLISCKKESENTIKQNSLNDNAFIVGTTSILSATANTVVMTKNDSTIKQAAVGNIILAAPSVNCPNGLLQKITNVVVGTNTITCQTEQSNLNEAFEELHVSNDYVETFTADTFFRGTGSSLSYSFNDNATLANGIKIKGTIKFDIPKVTFIYEKEKGSLSPNNVVIKAEFNSAGSTLEFTNPSAGTITLAKKILSDITLPPITVIVPVGGLPFPIKFKQKIVLQTMPFDVSGKMKFQVFPAISTTIGCKYENGSWQNLSTYSIDASSLTKFTKQDFILGGAEVTAKMTLFNPRYEIAPMYLDDLKTYFEIPNSVSLSLSNTEPNYSLKYKCDVTGGVEQSFWLGGSKTYSITGNAIEKTLLEGIWTDILIRAVNGNTTTGDTPAISVDNTGANWRTLGLNTYIDFWIDKNNPNLYLWTCTPGCFWQSYSVPTTLGQTTNYDFIDQKRKVSFTRIQ